MSLNMIMNTATSGLAAAQTQLRVISDNVSNVNTPGYVRKIADQVAVSSQGVGAGVEVARIRLATDRFLQSAALNAGADAARQGVRYELYDRIQSLFGDPGGDRGFFTQIDQMFAAFAAAAEDPVSSPLRQDSLLKVQALFDEARRISGQIQAVREDADGRIVTAVEAANSLLQQIERLNGEIAGAEVVGADSTGAQTAQATLITQLSELMDVRITPRSNGGVTIRTGSGALLAGQGYATLSYVRAGAVTSETQFGEIWVTEPHGEKRPLTDSLTSGEIRGLLEVRDLEAPMAAERLAELVTRAADELNRAHNASSAVPAPSSLTGRNVGQSLETALQGFTGVTTIALVDAQGVIQQRVEIDFSGGVVTINGVASSAATFLADLGAATGGALTADFTGGRLSLTASGGLGVAIGDDAAAPSRKADRGFSHYFGLNDLMVTDVPAVYDQGLTGTSLHGFSAGETVSFRFTDAGGARIRDLSVAVPAGAGDMNELLAALNNPVTGAGRYGTFSLDAAGNMTFAGLGEPPIKMAVTQDNTRQVPSGVSLTQLTGMDAGARAGRADGFTLRTDVRQNPNLLALGQLRLDAAVGDPALSKGDGRGARALADAGQYAAAFGTAGGAAGGRMSVSRYASELSGDIGSRAAAAKTRAETSAALFTEANARRTSIEGVNLDEELVMMTTYQQAFNASARLIQAAKDMYDVLLGMV